MPNTSCLFGPAFSITGESYYSSTAVNFEVNFDNSSDQALVLAYEWYLDNTLMIGQNIQQLIGQIDCGTHTIGVRILSAEGWSGVKNQQFFTCKVPSALQIYGPDSIYEGSTADYYVLQLYTDGTSRDVTAQYTLTSTTGGTFNGNVFTATVDDTSYNSIQVTIGANRNGVQEAEKQITINNTTPIVQVSLLIVGPDTVNEGASAAYSVISTYSDGTQQDLTAGYTFSATVGTFAGNTLSIPADGILGNSRAATISAAKNGAATLSKQITIIDITIKAGILVVDLYNNAGLNAIGLIDNAEVSVNHVAVYTGNNFLPAASAPADAFILASDFNSSTLTNWRFEFNLAKLVSDYPGTQSFVMYVKGRSNAAGTISGAFSARTNDAKMTMQGSPGSYIPSVTGGNNIIELTNISGPVAGGANNSYNENDLSTIIRFVYDVPADTVSYTMGDAPIEIKDFDYMAVTYQWEVGSGNDLDILVGYENNQTVFDGVYVGFGQGSTTIPVNAMPVADAYLWWGLDRTQAPGVEGVLVGIKQFIANVQNLPNIIEIGLYAVWFQDPPLSGTGNFTVRMVTYKGGTMSLVGTEFKNSGGTEVSNDLMSVQTLKTSREHLPATSEKIGTVKYNQTTKTTVIEITKTS